MRLTPSRKTAILRKTAIVTFLTLAFTAPSFALDVEGVWLTDEKTSKIEITDCGDGTPCGKIAWIDEAALSPEQIAAGGAKDKNNPDPALRDQFLVGVTMVDGFERKKDRWKNGRIYDPNDGKSYRSALRLKKDGTLEVKGCIGPFCRSLIWTPSTLEDLATSDTSPAADAPTANGS